MPITSISNGTIIDISSQRNDMFITVTYRCGSCSRREEQTIRLVVNSQTIILNRNGVPVSADRLRVGMTINATISSATTRSIPPQATALIIRITGEATSGSVTSGSILNVDQRNRSFTLLSGGNLSDIIQFNVSENTRILNRMGRPVSLSDLNVGMRVRVRHADFMTASIPPQTTAFEVRVL